MKLSISLAACSLTLATAQQVGTFSTEEHPPLPIQRCTVDGCVTQDTSVVIDHMWRWTHKVDSYDTCMSDNDWTCGDAKTCGEICAVEGVSRADYSAAYGVSTSGSELTLRYSEKYSSRLFLIDKDDKYPQFKMLNQEISFDIDNSDLDCGMIGAMEFAEVEEDGGMAKFPTNKAGAKYGTGYCDAVCPKLKFVDGTANQDNRSHCCAEFDLWEGNRFSAAYTTHVLARPGQYTCTSDCESVVDYWGCQYNAYLAGNHSFYGPNATFTLDSTQKMTVVTQFVTNDSTADGELVDIRRLYVQDGKIVANSFYGSSHVNSITDPYCANAMGEHRDHFNNGALKAMGQAFKRGMGMLFSIWTDETLHATWLDAGDAGTCPMDSGDPEVLMKQGASVKFSNVRYGDIGTTYAVPLYSRCGGIGYDGPTACAQGTCTKMNDFYSQCDL